MKDDTLNLEEWAYRYRPTIGEVRVYDHKVIFYVGDYGADWEMIITNTDGRTTISVVPSNPKLPTVQPVTIDGASPVDALRTELNVQLNNLRNALFKIQENLGNVSHIVNTILFASGVYSYDGKINNEDIGLLDLMNYVSFEHSIYSPKGVLHYRTTIDGTRLEYDFVVIGTTLRDWKRVVGIEFKETDFPKAVSQAISRKDYVHYQYVVVKLSAKDIVNAYWDSLVLAKENGIGVVTVDYAGHPSVLLKAKFTKAKKTIYDDVKAWIDERERELREKMDHVQKKIFEFIRNGDANAKDTT